MGGYDEWFVDGYIWLDVWGIGIILSWLDEYGELGIGIEWVIKFGSVG